MWSVVHFPFTCDGGGLKPGGDRRRGVGRRPHLDENRHVLQITAAPPVEGLQQLQAVALGVDVHLEAAAIGRRVLVGVLAGVEVFDGELVAVGGIQLELLATGGRQEVGLRVELERSSDGERGDDLKERRRRRRSSGRTQTRQQDAAAAEAHLRGGDEGVRGRVGVVPGREVSVEGSDDGVLLPLLHVTPERKDGICRLAKLWGGNGNENAAAQTCPTGRCRAHRRWPGPRPQHH